MFCKTYSKSSRIHKQSYTAVNVKAINRTSDNLAQLINNKEDKRLAKKLTSIDREKTVFRNSITRDEKILLQRSKALATVLLARTSSGITRTSSSTTRPSESTARTNPLIISAPARRIVSCPVKPSTGKADQLYGEEATRFAPTKRSRTANFKRSVSSESTDQEERTPSSANNTHSCKTKLLWANSVNNIMKRDIKAWHKAFLVSKKCVTVGPASPHGHLPVPTTSNTGKTPTIMPEIVKSMVSTPVIREPLDSESISKLFSDRDIDKGAWITNYINTSCAEHFPMI